MCRNIGEHAALLEWELTIFGQIIANSCLNMVKSSIFMDYIMLYSRREGSRGGGHEKDILLNCGDNLDERQEEVLPRRRMF